MLTQTHTKPATIFDLVLASLSVDLPAEPTHASSRDYGFDFDQEELAEELAAPMSSSLLANATQPLSAEEYGNLSLF